MKLKLIHGRGEVSVDVPEENLAVVLRKSPAPPLAEPERMLHQSLQSPIEADPLARLAAERESAVIVISDITRPVPNRLLLPPILQTLADAGLAREKITILIATGMHTPNTGPLLDELVGPDIAAHWRIVNHDGRDADSHTTLGMTARGTPVRVDTRYCRADLKILTGLVEPHFMAGFSGGCKSIAPGCAHIDTIRCFHGYEMLADPRTQTGCVADNPFQQEVRAIGALAGCDFISNVVLDEERRPTGIFSGDCFAAHDAAMEMARRTATATVDRPVDICVTGCGGYPLDTSFYQCVKGLCNAAAVTRPGGTIVAAGGCADGFGSDEFRRQLMHFDRIEDFISYISDPAHFTIDQWEVQMLERVVRERDVLFHTIGVDAEDLARAFVEPVDSVQAGLKEALSRHGSAARVAVIPEGPYVLADVAGR